MPRDPFVGTVVDGKYQIAQCIGSGGMGTVYRAVHVSLGAPRALKVMRPELAHDGALVERFRSEAVLAAGLRHPHLVTVYDFGPLPSGGWYIVSELVEGSSLASLLRRKGVRFAARDVARLMGQLADGLALAHGRGIVHRDISPDNIMLAAVEGQVVAKLLDFGIAKDTAAASVTGMGWNMGKIGFSSPEQLGALRPGETIDARSDVFSLAAVAYLMVAGHLPWRRGCVQDYTHDVLLSAEDELKARLRAGAPKAWRDVLAGALARSRDRRLPDMSTLKAQFADAASRTPATHEPPPFPVKALRRASREIDAPLPPEPTRTPPSAPPPRVVPDIVPSAAFAADLSLLEAQSTAAPRTDVRPHVVVLDDDDALRAALPALLEAPDLHAIAAPWRGDAAGFAAAQQPDLILVDVDADENAAERLRRLRAEPRLKQVPMILFSCVDEWALRAMAGRTGASGYLPKTALGRDFAGAVRRLLRQAPPRTV